MQARAALLVAAGCLAAAASGLLGGGARAAGGAGGGAPPDEQAIEEERVLALGDPARLRIEGAKAFSPAAIADALRWDFDTQIAAHPAAPLAGLLSTLRERIAEGYRQAGFPDVGVEAKADTATATVRVVIVEGPRLRCGRVIVTGAERIAAGEIAAALAGPEGAARGGEAGEPAGATPTAAPRPPARATGEKAGPVWAPGEPASLAPETRDEARRRVEEIYRGRGYFFAKVEAEVRRRDEAGRADLAITLAGEGPPGRIGEVVVEGAERNAKESVLAVAGVKAGETVDGEAVAAASDRLMATGRFLTAAVTPEPMAGEGRVRLKIALREYPFNPPLGSALTEGQAALLKLYRWLERWPETEEDLEVALGDPALRGIARVRVLSSPRRGLAAVIERRDGESAREGAVVLAPGHAGLYDTASGRRSAGPSFSGSIFLQADLSPRMEGSERINFYIGGGVRGAAAAPGAEAVRLDLRLHPAAFLTLADYLELTASVEGDLVTLANSRVRLVIERRSGRLVDSAMRNESGAAEIRIRFAKGLYEAVRARFVEGMKDAPNAYDPGRPFGSYLRFLAETVVPPEVHLAGPSGGERPARGVAVLIRLLDHGVVLPLERLMAEQSTAAAPAKFLIPPRLRPESPADFMHLVARAVVPGADFLFPRYSWPWTLAREAALSLAGEGRYTDLELSRLLDPPATGPLGCLAAATLLRHAGRPEGAAVFARRGLADLSTERFLGEVFTLLEGDALLTRSVIHAAGVVRGLSPEDIAALSALLPEGDRRPFARFLEALAKDPEKPLGAVLAEALAAYWEGGMKARVAAALRQFVP